MTYQMLGHLTHDHSDQMLKILSFLYEKKHRVLFHYEDFWIEVSKDLPKFIQGHYGDHPFPKIILHGDYLIVGNKGKKPDKIFIDRNSSRLAVLPSQLWVEPEVYVKLQKLMEPKKNCSEWRDYRVNFESSNSLEQINLRYSIVQYALYLSVDMYNNLLQSYLEKVSKQQKQKWKKITTNMLLDKIIDEDPLEFFRGLSLNKSTYYSLIKDILSMKFESISEKSDKRES